MFEVVSVSEAEVASAELLPGRLVMSVFMALQQVPPGEGSTFQCDASTAFALIGQSGLTPEEQACVNQYVSSDAAFADS